MLAFASSGGASNTGAAGELDARKAAFCKSNPTDLRCAGTGNNNGGSTGSITEEQKRIAAILAYCAANPADPRCPNTGASDGGNNDGRTNDVETEDGGATHGGASDKSSWDALPEEEQSKFCASNPSDPKCGG